MPEALAVFVVFIISVVVYVAARIHASNPANYRPDEELKRLAQQEDWLNERLTRAQREGWSEEMHHSIKRDLHDNAVQRHRATQKRATQRLAS